MARPTRLTPQVHEAIVRAVTAGVPLAQAAALVGVGRSTVLEWIQCGEGRLPRGGQARYTAFSDAITGARAVDEARRIARLEAAGRGGLVLHEKTTTYPDGRTITEKQFAPPDWKSDAWFLEHAYPERWGRRVQANLSVEVRRVAAEVAAEIGVSAEDLLREAQAFLKKHDRRHLR
jgi:hypothetical protein